MTDETKSKKPEKDFPCKTKINANSYCKKFTMIFVAFVKET